MANPTFEANQFLLNGKLITISGNSVYVDGVQVGIVGVDKNTVGLGNVTNDAQVKRTEMGVANGVATLDSGGLVPYSELPHIQNTLYYPADEPSMLALPAQVLDVALRGDNNLYYLLVTNDPTNIDNWLQLLGWSGYSGYSGATISGYSGYSGNSTSGYSGYSGNILVTVDKLTSGSSSTIANSFTTATVQPSPNKLILLAVTNSVANIILGNANIPTASGNGLTYVRVGTTPIGDTGYENLTLFRAMGNNPGSGAITISFSGQNQSTCTWSLVEFDHVDISDVNGAGAVFQTTVTSAVGATNLNISLPNSFQNSLDSVYGVFGVNSNQTLTPGNNFNLLDTENITSSGFSTSLLTEWLDINQSSINANGTPADWGGIAIEIKCSSAGSSGYSGYSGLTTSGYSGYSGLSGYSGNSPSGVTSYVTGADYTQSSFSLTDVTGLSFSGSPNKTYEVNVLLITVINTSSNNFQCALQYSSGGATTAWVGQGILNGTVTQIGSQTYNVSGGDIPSISGSIGIVTMKGWIQTGSNTGNITVRVASSAGGSLTVYRGSRLTVTDITQ